MKQQKQTDNTSLERSALIVATLTSFMGPFMISSVNVALPAIQMELDMSAVQLSWIATSYLLAVAIGLIPAGKYADIHGRKKVFATGLGVYTFGSVAAAVAPSAALLILTRSVQGLGAAMFVTTGMAILTSIFPPHKRGKAIGLYVSAVYIGLSVGPFAGGIITQAFGWRTIFWIMLPMGLLSLLVTLHYLKGEWHGEANQRLDIPGCLFYGVTIFSLVYGATRLPGYLGFFLVICGFCLLVAFLFYQRKARFPVFEVELFFSNRTFCFSSLAALLNYSATFGVTFLLSLYLQYIQGMTPQAAGTALMVQPVMMALLSPFAGKMSDRLEPRILATSGMALTVIGVVIFSFLEEDTSLSLILATLLLLGTGFALFSSPNMSAIMGAVEKRYYGQASGAVATMRLLGQMFSMAVATVVLAFYLGESSITPENHNLFMISIRTVFTISAVFCLAGVFFSWSRGAVFDK